MEYLIYALPLTITAILLKIMMNQKKQQNHADETVIRQPHMYYQSGLLIVGLYLFVAFMILILPIENPFSEKIIATIVICILGLSGFIFIFMYVYWRIQIEKDVFVYTNFLNQTKTYRYEECRYYTQSAHTLIYYQNKIIIKIPYLTSDELLRKKLKMVDTKQSLADTDHPIQLRYNGFTLTMGYVFLVCGLFIASTMTYAFIFEQKGQIGDIALFVVGVCVLLFGFTAFMTGLMMLLLYYFFRININQEDIQFRNFIGKKRTFSIKDMDYKPTNHGYILYHKGKRITYLNEAFVDHTFLLRALYFKKR